MTAGWVAGSVRARALTRRRLGAGGARALAGEPSLDAALARLATSPYGHEVRSGQSLAVAEHAVGDVLLWHLRVLAGWLPAEGAGVLRVLAGGFEIANTDEHLRRLAGRDSEAYGVVAPYRLGRLATAWPRLARTSTIAEVAEVLRASAWGDPGDASERGVRLAMRLSWARQVAGAVPPARDWAAAGAALVIARVLPSRPGQVPAAPERAAAALLGSSALHAGTLRELAERIPGRLRWVLADLPTAGAADELWRAEGTWWRRVESDGFAMVLRSAPGPEVPLGAAAVLAADAWRVRAALELAARGGAAPEAFDAVA
jgi:hypothetical protein